MLKRGGVVVGIIIIIIIIISLGRFCRVRLFRFNNIACRGVQINTFRINVTIRLYVCVIIISAECYLNRCCDIHVWCVRTVLLIFNLILHIIYYYIPLCTRVFLRNVRWLFLTFRAINGLVWMVITWDSPCIYLYDNYYYQSVYWNTEIKGVCGRDWFYIPIPRYNKYYAVRPVWRTQNQITVFCIYV